MLLIFYEIQGHTIYICTQFLIILAMWAIEFMTMKCDICNHWTSWKMLYAKSRKIHLQNTFFFFLSRSVYRIPHSGFRNMYFKLDYTFLLSFKFKMIFFMIYRRVWCQNACPNSSCCQITRCATGTYWFIWGISCGLSDRWPEGNYWVNIFSS